MKSSNHIKIAIHHRPGSFSDRWIAFCKENQITYQIVNCYESDIIKVLQPYDLLLWHWHQDDVKAILFARQLIVSLKNLRIKVFPDINTCWHFDDKIGQKYLLESIDAPLVPSYVFYDKEQAIDWINQADFPKVFKLRGGAGSHNVKLVPNRVKAQKLCRIAFGNGFEGRSGYFADFSKKIKKTQQKKNYSAKLRRLPASLWNIYLIRKMRSREKGYLYFQEFIPDNKYDTRVTIIGNRAFAFRRMVRASDFRASGSGEINYDMTLINKKCIEAAFMVSEKLKTQSIAFDFIEDKESAPLIVEVSYCYMANAIKACSGHWDKDLNWHEGSMWPQDAILSDLIQTIKGHQE
jgi:glutathione synthase/RimK-type ligase-like ATP-grasp enzyme